MGATLHKLGLKSLCQQPSTTGQKLSKVIKMRKKKGQARALYPREIKRALKVCSVTQEPDRNRLILLLSHCCGLRVSELAQLKIKDVLFPSGKLRDECRLPGAYAKMKKPRLIWLSHSQLRAAAETYLALRIKRRQATTLDPSQYRGLNPFGRLILNSRGASYGMNPKPRTMQDGTVREYWACDSMERLFRDLYKRGGLTGASSHSGRRSMATNLDEQGVPLETIQRLLGHADPEHTLPYIEIRQKRIRAAFADAF
ncbi:MAG: site-specific integrase [Motiliproteus sp.]